MSQETSYHPCPGCQQFVDTKVYGEHVASGHKAGVYLPPVMQIPPQSPAQIPAQFQYPPQQGYAPNYSPPQKTSKSILTSLNDLFADRKHRKAVLVLAFIMFAIGWMLRSFFTT